MELWKTVENTNNAYEISSYGKLKRIKPEANTFNGRILKPGLMRGYLNAVFYNKGERVQKKIHTLVLHHFCRPKNKGECANHKNGIKTDNRIENLEWVTFKQNSLHSTKVLKKNIGQDNKRSKLKETDIHKIRALFKHGISNYRIAKIYNVSITLIRYIKIKRIWTHI